jgi:hypothetical protein
MPSVYTIWSPRKLGILKQVTFLIKCVPLGVWENPNENLTMRSRHMRLSRIWIIQRFLHTEDYLHHCVMSPVERKITAITYRAFGAWQYIFLYIILGSRLLYTQCSAENISGNSYAINMGNITRKILLLLVIVSIFVVATEGHRK